MTGLSFVAPAPAGRGLFVPLSQPQPLLPMRTPIRTTIRTLALAALTLALLSVTDAVGQTVRGDMTPDEYDDETQIMSVDQGDTTRLILLPVFVVQDGEYVSFVGVDANPDTVRMALAAAQDLVNHKECSVAKITDVKTPDGAVTKAGVEDYFERKGRDSWIRGWKVVAIDCPSDVLDQR